MDKANSLVNRLRKLDWDDAMVFIKGMQQPIQLQNEGKNSKFRVENDHLIVAGLQRPIPPPPPEPGQPTQPVRTVTFDLYISLYEIVLAEFYEKPKVKSLIVAE